MSIDDACVAGWLLLYAVFVAPRKGTLKTMDEAGLRAIVAKGVTEHWSATGRAATTKDMVAVIKTVQARLQQAGVRAEGRIVSEMVKQALAG